MAYTLSDLRTKVQRRIKDTAYSTTEIDDALNDAQNDVFNEYPTLRFMKTSEDYTLSTSTADITNGSAIPTNFGMAIDMTDTSTSREKVITFMALDDLKRQYPDPFDVTAHPANYPSYWTWDGVTPKVYPLPADAYTFTFSYYKNPTLLTTESQVPEIPSEFSELLVAGATYRILQANDNYDQAAIHQNKYDELLQKLVVKYSQNQTAQVFVMPVNVVTTSGNF